MSWCFTVKIFVVNLEEMFESLEEVSCPIPCPSPIYPPTYHPWRPLRRWDGIAHLLLHWHININYIGSKSEAFILTIFRRENPPCIQSRAIVSPHFRSCSSKQKKWSLVFLTGILGWQGPQGDYSTLTCEQLFEIYFWRYLLSGRRSNDSSFLMSN